MFWEKLYHKLPELIKKLDEMSEVLLIEGKLLKDVENSSTLALQTIDHFK